MTLWLIRGLQVTSDNEVAADEVAEELNTQGEEELVVDKQVVIPLPHILHLILHFSSVRPLFVPSHSHFLCVTQRHNLALLFVVSHGFLTRMSVSLLYHLYHL